MGAQRVFQSLPAEFVRGEMIGFAVGFGGDGVGVGCQVVEFRGSGMRALGHDVLLGRSMQTGRLRSLESSIDAGCRISGLDFENWESNSLYEIPPGPSRNCTSSGEKCSVWSFGS